jgi:hypothetical protein
VNGRNSRSTGGRARDTLETTQMIQFDFNVASRARTLQHIGVHFFGGALEIFPSMISISASCAETRKVGYIDGNDCEPTSFNKGATFLVGHRLVSMA